MDVKVTLLMCFTASKTFLVTHIGIVRPLVSYSLHSNLYFSLANPAISRATNSVSLHSSVFGNCMPVTNQCLVFGLSNIPHNIHCILYALQPCLEAEQNHHDKNLRATVHHPYSLQTLRADTNSTLTMNSTDSGDVSNASKFQIRMLDTGPQTNQYPLQY